MSAPIHLHLLPGRPNSGETRRLWRAGDMELPERPALLAVMEAMPSPLLAFDANVQVVELNGRAARLFGQPARALRGRPLADLLDTAAAEQLYTRILGVATATDDNTIRATLHGPRGSMLPVSLSIQPIHDGEQFCWLAAVTDLSSEARLQAQIDAHENRLRRILDALPVGAWLIDESRQLIADNASGRRLWRTQDTAPSVQYWRGPLRQPDSKRLLSSEERPEEQARRTGQPIYNVPLELITCDGLRRSVLYSAIPLAEDSGEVLITQEETTELTALRKTIQQTQDLFDAFFQSPAGGVVLVRPDGILHAANPAFCELVGYTDAELRGKTMADLTHPDDRLLEAQQFQMLHRGEIDGFHLEKRYVRRNGEISWALLSVSMLRESDGQPIYALHTVQRIDMLKAHQAELEQRADQLTTLTEHDPDAIGRFDRELCCIYANPALRNLVPALSEGLLPLARFDLSPHVMATWKAVMQLVLQDGQPRSFEFSLLHGVGEEAFLVKVVPEPPGLMPVQTLMVIARDITGLKAKEGALRRHEEELQASRATIRSLAAYHEKVREEERKHIAREIHDELGQRLTALKLETSVAQHHARQQDQAQLLDDLGQLASGIEDMVQLVRDVAANLRPAALNLGIVPALEWLTTQFRRQHRMPCEARLPDDNLALDDARATIVFRIVQESLTNIARHARATRASVALTLMAAGWARLVVTDNGCGFDPAVRPKRPTYGLLGISERALMLGGTLTVSARPGSGTRLTVEFPLEGGRHDPTVSD